MARWALTNGHGYDAFPESEDDLVRGLTEIDSLSRRERRPRIAVLASDADAEHAPHLSIGLGVDESVLVYEEGDDERGGYSKGSRVGDNTPVMFAYGTATNEYLRWMLIPIEDAVAATVEFFRTSSQPTTVEWADL